MGWTVQTFGSKSDVLKDSDLLLALGMMVEAIDDDPNSFSALSQFSEHWRQLCDHHGPGLVDLKLETIGASEQAIEELKLLIAVVESELLEFGSKISANMVNKRWRIHGIVYGETETSHVRETLKSIGILIND
jgi:hypothetical protein